MKNKAFALMALFCCLFTALWAQNPSADRQTMSGPWKDIQELALPKPSMEDPSLPEKFRLLELNVEQLKGVLQQILPQAQVEPKASYTFLDVPMPDGSFQKFKIENAPVMHPDLAAKFPDIHSFAGTGVDNPAAKIYFDFNPFGFHAMIMTAGKAPFFVEPVSRGDIEHYLSYEYTASDWEKMKTACSNLTGFEAPSTPLSAVGQKAGDCQLRTYRLALAANVEFTAAFVNPTDPTGVNGVMNTFATLVMFVNGFYITELAVRLQLVANNNLLIFTASDNYTNGDEGTMAGENQGIVDGAIGNGSYDIARAYGTLPSGGARGISLEIGNVCQNGSKAHGATVTASPAGLGAGGFATLEMHEMGHQFGANHTFNENNLGSCTAGQLSGATAYEPGSGSTILSYGGTCNGSDVQGFRSNYFHAISLQEIGNYISVGAGNTCPTTVGLANNAPTVSVSGAATYTIPASTAFRLTATGNDTDGDPLTYCWEQFDNQLISHPPLSTASNGPVFRSITPSASPTRYFPNLPAILNGTNPTWEVLPSVSRTMNFQVTVRDNTLGGGCTDEDAMSVNVVGTAGPFAITGVGANPVCLLAEDNTTITWNVANTTAAPVNCANVDIWLSLDGGTTFTILLVGGTPNDGTQQVAIPANAVTTQGRIMVIGSNNIFLDINNSDIRIDCPMNRTVTDNPASGVYKVRDKLQTSGPVEILPFTTARFFAGNEVALKPGFRAHAGCDFMARIKPCDPCVAGKPQDLVDGTENPKVYFYEIPTSDRTNGTLDSPLKAFAFPNPFDQNFTLSFELPTAGKVEIQLMDFTGREIQTVYQNDSLDAGKHQVPIVTNQLGVGVYNCRILSNGHQAQVKLVKIN
ncbi:MAG: T9SS type A sorting domain-containing protein [Phycisphaerae bacterium]|nr:T9SS type A sorting domain-containing protein [Saprospiraceae bacterium]